jgi:hypothetical protein
LDPLYEQVPTEEFLFSDRRAQPRSAGKVAYDASRYPYVYSEMGGGIQMTYPHRPVVPAECVKAQAIVALGNGTNWLGYYMYHGGTNPVGKHSYLNEYTVPRLSYDFQAPLGEYGQVHASYHHLRLLHLFLQEWGEALAPMAVTLPAGHEELTPVETRTARLAARSLEGTGFLFLNNYQDHVEMQDHEQMRLRVKLPGETLVFPPQGGLRLQNNVSAILPFNLRLPQGVLLKYATAQPVTIQRGVQQTICVFFAPAGMEAIFAFDQATCQAITVTDGVYSAAHGYAYCQVQPGLTGQMHITALDGTTVTLLVLTQEQALTLWKLDIWGEERLVLANGLIQKKQEGLEVVWQGEQTLDMTVFPAWPASLASSVELQSIKAEHACSRYTLTAPEQPVPLEIVPLSRQTTRIRVPANALVGLNDIFLRIDYLGDVGSLYLDGHLVSDNFASELPWEIGLKRFLTCEQDLELILHISPLAVNDPKTRYLRRKIAACTAASDDAFIELFSIKAIPEYHALLTQ